jgi:hypothetical protein
MKDGADCSLTEVRKRIAVSPVDLPSPSAADFAAPGAGRDRESALALLSPMTASGKSATFHAKVRGHLNGRITTMTGSEQREDGGAGSRQRPPRVATE